MPLDQHDLYMATRDRLLAEYFEQGRANDKAVLALAGVAWGFSISLATTGDGGHSPSEFLAKWSWVMFGVAVLAALIGMHASHSASWKARQILDECASQSPENIFGSAVRKWPDIWQNRVAGICSWLAIACVSLGVATLTLSMAVSRSAPPPGTVLGGHDSNSHH